LAAGLIQRLRAPSAKLREIKRFSQETPAIDRFHQDFANYETAFEVADIEEAFDQVKYNELVEPKNYDEAWNHPDKFQQAKWREAISKEFRDMNRRKVWKKIDQR
jgi:hypothetical protein